MVKRELMKPRKVVWVMRDFINEIHNLTYTVCTVPTKREDETIEEFFARLENAEEIEIPSKVKMVYREKGFAVCPDGVGEEEFFFFYNLESLYSKGHFQFAQDFFSRCPTGRGFASITLSILHEIGHLKTIQKFENYNRTEAIEELFKNFPMEIINFEYFKLPDEKAATDWAIEWLSHPENRRKAKEFEKKFFECFKKKA